MKKINNSSLVILCFGLLSSVPMFAHVSVKLVSHDKIVQYQKELARTLYIHKLVRATLMCGGVVWSAFEAYKWLAKESSTVVQVEEIIETIAEPKEWFFISMAKGMRDTVANLFTYEGGGGLVQLAAFLSVRQVISGSLVRYAFHPYTLKWCIKTYAPYTKTIEALQEYTTLYHEAKTDNEAALYHTFIIDLCEKLVLQCERLCASMRVCCPLDDALLQAQVDRVIVYLTDCTNSWVQEVNEESLLEKTQQLSDVFAREIKHVRILFDEL